MLFDIRKIVNFYTAKSCAELNGVQEAASSNLVTRTKKNRPSFDGLFFFICVPVRTSGLLQFNHGRKAAWAAFFAAQAASSNLVTRTKNRGIPVGMPRFFIRVSDTNQRPLVLQSLAANDRCGFCRGGRSSNPVTHSLPCQKDPNEQCGEHAEPGADHDPAERRALPLYALLHLLIFHLFHSVSPLSRCC